MRFFSLLAASGLLVLCTSVLPAAGQAISYTLLGHERTVGPVGQSVYYQTCDFQSLFTLHSNMTQSENASLKQPSIVRPILGAVVGYSAGWLVSIGLAGLVIDDIPRALIIPAAIGMVFTPPLLAAAGAHRGNKSLGNFPITFAVSATPMAVLWTVLLLIQDVPPIIIVAPLLFLPLPLAITVERLTAAKNLRARWP